MNDTNQLVKQLEAEEFVESRKDTLVVEIEKEISQICSAANDCFIFRIGDQLRKVNENAYTPEVIAIGPYHHGNPSLQAMEGHKLRYLQFLLNQNREFSVGRFVTEVRNLGVKARKCYEEPINLSEDEFVKMLLLDSCFVVELFRKFFYIGRRDYEDPVFLMEPIRSSIRRDLMLFENQLPFFMLEAFFNMTSTGNQSSESLIHLALHFISFILPGAHQDHSISHLLPDYEPNHLLGLLHGSYVPSCARHNENIGSPKVQELIECSTKLHEKGIKFKKAHGISLFDVHFFNGIMVIPALIIDNHLEAIFLNLVFYELHSQPGIPRYVSDYMAFMDCLIDSNKDIELLSRHGIIENLMGKDEAITRIFNRPADSFIAIGDHFSYSEVFAGVNKHCSDGWTQFMASCDKWMDSLKDNYFNSPWALISFLAATILLILTVVQTLYTVLSYDCQSDSSSQIALSMDYFQRFSHRRLYQLSFASASP